MPVPDSMPTAEISICILAGHGVEHLDACLASLRGQQEAPSFEVLIGGNPSAATRSVVHRHFPAAQICDTGGRLPGAARNPLIERARGELLLFLDDDVTFPPDLLRRLSAIARAHPEASVFGGPNDTPTGSSRFQVVQGAVLASLAGSGPVSRRYGARHPGFADERWFTLCNLAVRRRVMAPFLDELVCAEENELLAKLRRQGEPMRYEPSLRVFHARRATWGSFAKQMLKYGRGRGQLLARRPSTLRVAYVAPAILLIYLLLTPVLLALGSPSKFVLAPAAVYGLLVIASALRVGWTLHKATDAPFAAALILTIHVCYGAGVLRGLFNPGGAAEHAEVQWTPPASAESRRDGERGSVARASVEPGSP